MTTYFESARPKPPRAQQDVEMKYKQRTHAQSQEKLRRHVTTGFTTHRVVGQVHDFIPDVGQGVCLGRRADIVVLHTTRSFTVVNRATAMTQVVLRATLSSLE